MPPSSPASGSLLAASGSGIVAIDPTDGTAAPYLTCQPICVRSGAIAASPDGTSIAYSNDTSGSIWIVDVRTGSSRRLLTCSKAACVDNLPINSLSWSPGGKIIAFDWYRGIWTVGLDDQRSVLVEPNGQDVTFSPDGTRILYVAEPTGRVWMANVDGTSPHPLAFHATFAAWSPDGARIAYVTDGPNSACKSCGDPFVAQLWVADLNGPPTKPIYTIPGCCVGAWLGPPVWSPDGHWLAWPGGTATDKLVVVAADGSSALVVSYDYAPVIPTWFHRAAPDRP